ncbi:hypothetical protein B0H10DRAFT_1976081 [Mycena sp. CBHHK59/15]|nr:hypothetical protein B0H10DRAFT_1976081 [Mycena sp. CBHHK59/15]
MSALRMLIREAMGHDPLFREGDRWGAGVAVLPRRRRVCGGVERDTVRCGWAAGIRRRRCAGQRYVLSLSTFLFSSHLDLPFLRRGHLPASSSLSPSLSRISDRVLTCPQQVTHTHGPRHRRLGGRAVDITTRPLFYACRTAVRIAGPSADAGRAQTGREAIRASTSLCAVVLVDLCSSYLRRTTPLLRGEQRFRKRRAPSPTSSVRPVA